MPSKKTQHPNHSKQLVPGAPDYIYGRIALLCDFDGISPQEAEFKLFLRACAWFYGNLSLNDAYELYSKTYGTKATKQEFTSLVKWAKKHLDSTDCYEICPLFVLYSDVPTNGFWNQEIIHQELFKNEDREPLYYKIDQHKRQCDTPLCILPWKEFIVYSDGGRMINIGSRECRAAFRFLSSLEFSTKRKIENFLVRLIFNVRLGRNLLTFLNKDPFYKSLISSEIGNPEVCNQALGYIAEISNHTSTMINNGYSPYELKKLYQSDPKYAKNEPINKEVTFTKRTEKAILQGHIDEAMFAEMMGSYPEEIRQAAWKTYWQVRSKKKS